MTKNILISIGGIIVVIVVAVVLLTKHATAPDSTGVSVSPSVSASVSSSKSPSISPTPSAQAGGTKSYTLADVAQHPNETSCWSAINGSVYDLTSWIRQHPGGADKILSICGKDGTAAFVDQHDSKQREQDILKTFLIGTLAK